MCICKVVGNGHAAELVAGTSALILVFFPVLFPGVSVTLNRGFDLLLFATFSLAPWMKDHDVQMMNFTGQSPLHSFRVR